MDLQYIYQQPENQLVLQPKEFVEGLLFGAGVAPEIPMPDAWLTWTIANHGQMQSTQQADEITDALFAYFKHCLAMMTNNQVSLPTYIHDIVTDKGDLNANKGVFEDDRDFFSLFGEGSKPKLWLNGLLLAHSHCEEVWQNAWKLMQAKTSNEKSVQLAKELKHCLSMFSTFADLPLAVEQAKARKQTDFLDKLPLVARSLPSALQSYVDVSGELAAFLPNQFETFVQKPN
ncbi:UPF0149 family protein [Glaciecola sp. MH2013]|uniref:UPF0149 family protein n=1 Tax=Glaciecola sp. MH2013 TaxID=2785524 RepID=UPI00189CDBA3|nr:UPF0149 family protein [Glaciecola sp. MH2013]MBF7073809.1 UPF0149 family protein [Glaciecola sp. MH2013]